MKARQSQVLRRLALATAIVAVVAPVVIWQTYVRHSGDLSEYSQYLVDEGAGAPEPGTLKVTAIGTTMFLVDDGTTQIILDPFISQVGLVAAALDREVSTDPAAVDRALERAGADRVEAIYVSHSHHDHALDTAYVAERTGATVHGSESTLNIARGGGIPETQLQMLDTDQVDAVGGLTIRALPSRHSPDPLGGEGATIDAPLEQPSGIRSYAEGGTFDLIVSNGEITALFKNSANWVPGALDGLGVDALFLGVAGLGLADATFVREYLDATIGTVDPALVVPTHWNDFFSEVSPALPLQRKLIDDTPDALDSVIDRARHDGLRVALLDAFATISIPPGRS